ncbi:MAG: PKD domain-containing protein, partial [Bacteroidales bacterium]|nr:PKD domain-containing protein [Bacteroidales bacterium]
NFISQSGDGVFFNGEIAEIIAFDTIDNDMRNIVHDYLLSKYLVSISLGLDIHVPYGFCDTAITTAYNPDFTSYLWSTGETDSVIHVNQPGRYTVTVTNSFGVTSTDDIKVYFPEVLQLQDTTICAGDTIRWDLKLSQNDYSYQWFKDGVQYSNDNHDISISEEGAYSCIITDSLGCTFQTDTMHLSIDNYEYTAGFNQADTTLCYGNRLHIASGYEETIAAIWQDGNTDLEYYLSQPGTYTVTTTNNRGCTATSSINVNLQGQVPVANFSIEGHCQNAEVYATNLSISEMGEISLYRWYANDSIIGTDENASHIFTEYGQQNIKLYLETTDNCINDTTISVYIDPQPQPDFAPKFFCQNAPTEIQTRSSIIEGNIESHSWSINGETYYGDNINTTFTGTGINHITLSSESNAGCHANETFEVNVMQAEIPVVEISEICIGQETNFLDKTPFSNINPQVTWRWDFGDETALATSRNTTHRYDSAGTYNVSLDVTYANHCTSRIDTTLTIYPTPEVSIANSVLCIGGSNAMEAEIQSGDSIVEYIWRIGDNFESHERNPIFTADTFGTLDVNIDILTEHLCHAHADNTMDIYLSPEVSFTQSRDWGGNPMFVEFENTSEDAASFLWDFGGEGESTQRNPYFVFTNPGVYYVTLYGTSEHGCTSIYTSSAITVVEPVVDIMLMDLKTTIENSFAKISFVIVNLGTLPVENLVLELKFNDRTLRESIDYIAQGEVRPYTFGTQMPVPQSNDIKSTICVEAIVPDTEGHSDTNLTNNILCITDAENLSVGIPYPIPASEQITCDIYTKIPTDLDISIFSIYGELVKHNTINQHKGYLKYEANVTDLSAGMYFIRVNSKDESITHKFEIR